jgi:hemolysin activation/secretion protein
LKHTLLLILFFFSNFYVFSQQDSVKLPFSIAHEKKLSDEDLKNKKEGTYVTGVPRFSSDPVNGFGYGVEGMLYYNGKKSDPFFNYTPYRRKLTIELFNTTKNQNEVVLGLDIPYIFNSKWRFRVEGIYENDPNMLYFGVNEQSLQTLTNPETGNNFSNYSQYDKSLSETYRNYNRWEEKNNVVMNLSAERSFFNSKMRTIIGYRFANLGISSFSGNSFLQNDFIKNAVVGVGRTTVNMAQAGIVYDTRDLESDPGKGIFAEITNEFSNTLLGSQFNFNKTFFQIKAYQRLFPSVFKKLIFAVRGGIGNTIGNAPFYEYMEEWSSEGGVYGVAGGGFSLRGYKQSRFAAPYITFINTELRMRFAQFKIMKQHLALSAVPFFDYAGVGDNLARVLSYSNNYRYSEGLGLRIAWNVSTILRFDYAVSNEDAQFFFQFGHTF